MPLRQFRPQMKTSMTPALEVHHSPLLQEYQQKIAAGEWTRDASQASAVVRLQALFKALQSASAKPPRGVYLYGPVGRGKSLVMDLFFEVLNRYQPESRGRRVHMHAFMDELHRRLHATELKQGEDLMTLMAQEIAATTGVLGFDEFYVTNIADAMVLGRLFDKLFACGVVVVATSNWAMDDLFQGGVNRDRFMPFIKKLQQYLEPVDMAEGTDYRQSHAANWPLYVVAQPGESAEAQLLTLFNLYAGGGDATLPKDFPHARRIKGHAAWFTFKELCETALGRGQYLNLLRSVDTLVIEGVPVLGAAEADATLRLVTLVDIAYENRKRIIISAAAYPSELCTTGPVAGPFRRTASRLAHLQSLSHID